MVPCANSGLSRRKWRYTGLIEVKGIAVEFYCRLFHEARNAEEDFYGTYHMGTVAAFQELAGVAVKEAK